MMKVIGEGLAMAVFYALALAYRALVVAGRLVAAAILPVISWGVRRFMRRSAPKSKSALVDMQVAPIAVQQSSAQEMVEDTGPATIIAAPQIEVADRIVSLRLEPPVGVINLRVYSAAGVVKRDLIVSEPHLKALMKGRRHTLPDATYDPVAGLDAIKDEAIEMAEKLINDLGNRTVRGQKPSKDNFVRSSATASEPTAAARATASVEAAAPQAASPAVPPAPAPRPDQPVHAVVAPKVTNGLTYVGRLVKAGSQTVRPKGRAPYEVFEATLQLDNGAELALRGSELERELLSAGCEVGGRVAITPMGKVPVTLSNGSEGQKNLYKVKRMEAPKKG